MISDDGSAQSCGSQASSGHCLSSVLAPVVGFHDLSGLVRDLPVMESFGALTIIG